MLIAMTDVDKVSRDLKPSPELFEMIQAAASSLTGFAQLWESIRKKGNSEGFTDEQLQWLLRPLLQDKLGMDRNKIYYLFHAEELKEKQRQRNPPLNIRQIDENKDLEDNSSPPPEEPPKDPIKIEPPETEEDPKDLEIAFLKEKVGELEEALKKTQQFTPANALDKLPEVIKSAEQRDKEAHSWLKNSADGIGTFYYDAYGIDLFKNRELPQLKNSGVKVFRRLYFEV